MRPQPSRAATPSTMSAPVDAITTTSGNPSRRAASAPATTISEVAADNGTPRKPDARSPPTSTHTTVRPLSSVRTSKLVPSAAARRKARGEGGTKRS